MNFRDMARTPALRAALFLLAAALVTLAWTLSRALRAEPLPVAASVTPVSLSGGPRRVIRAPSDIQGAVENDLFAEDRTAPASPYRMPDENRPDNTPRVEPAKPVVLGTAVASDGRSFATLQLGDASPTLVHVGDRIGEWVVKGITRGKVVLVNTSGTRAELTVSKPGI